MYRRATVYVLGLVLAVAASPVVRAAGFADVLDTPAQMSPLAGKYLMLSIAKAGQRLVAVGQRGHVVVSTDDGATWRQSLVPVSSDLTAVYFVDEKLGWAVGHDGVVLRSDDGGASWRLQLNGHQANELLVDAMQRVLENQPDSTQARALVDEAQRFREQGADKPFLDVWFADRDHGFIVGAYNLIFETTDGGKSWVPWFDRTDNPQFFNLYAVRPVAGDLYVAGEAGLLLRLDRDERRFVTLPSPYDGSYFGIAAAGSAVLAFGLRGNVYRSDDRGATWLQVDVGLPATVIASTHTAGGATLLADMGGRVVSSDDGGRSFRAVSLEVSAPIAGLVDVGAGRLAIVGPRGAMVTRARMP